METWQCLFIRKLFPLDWKSDRPTAISSSAKGWQEWPVPETSSRAALCLTGCQIFLFQAWLFFLFLLFFFLEIRRTRFSAAGALDAVASPVRFLLEWKPNKEAVRCCPRYIKRWVMLKDRDIYEVFKGSRITSCILSLILLKRSDIMIFLFCSI